MQPGREQEALAIWQSLRARSQHGDAAASEDLSVLTLLLAQLPAMRSEPQLCEALCESACDAAVLPRHRQEQLGRLVRLAVGRGDRPRAYQYLTWMVGRAPDLETDSEARVSAAAVATFNRDGERVLSLLGPRRDAVPVADSLDALASVLRANACETLGDPAGAAGILRELPDPQLLGLVTAQFPALHLCPASGQAYAAATTREAAQRAYARTVSIGYMMGGIFAFNGLWLLAAGLTKPAAGVPLVGVCFLVAGVLAVVRVRTRGKHAAWLRESGLPLTARILSAKATGTRINSVPEYRFTVQVAGPEGAYGATFDRVVPEHQVPMLLGAETAGAGQPGESLGGHPGS